MNHTSWYSFATVRLTYSSSSELEHVGLQLQPYRSKSKAAYSFVGTNQEIFLNPQQTGTFFNDKIMVPFLRKSKGIKIQKLI